jgi:hypothetical protein
MAETVAFVGLFGGLIVARIVVATIVFAWILPEADRCPVCDAPALRIQHGFWDRFFPRLRPSWCPECGWEGLMRAGFLSPAPTPGVGKMNAPTTRK